MSTDPGTWPQLIAWAVLCIIFLVIPTGWLCRNLPTDVTRPAPSIYKVRIRRLRLRPYVAPREVRNDMLWFEEEGRIDE